MSKPTIATVMPNYNHAAYLPAAIESVLSQTRPPDEFLIFDDASTDNSVEVIRSYAGDNPTIRLIQGTVNIGVHAAHRRLFELATCDYIDPMAADDLRYPRCYELALAMAEQYPRAGILFGKMVMSSPRVSPRPRWVRVHGCNRHTPNQSGSCASIWNVNRHLSRSWQPPSFDANHFGKSVGIARSWGRGATRWRRMLSP